MNDGVTTPTSNLERRAHLSAWWVFVLFNVVFRDLHDLFLPGKIATMLSTSPDELGMLAYGFRDADDYMFVGAELVGLWFIVKTAWRWRVTSGRA